MKDAESDSEDLRLGALRRYGILDTGPEQDFEEIVQLASEICGTPIALISLVDADRQWFKARTGTPRTCTPIEMSICAHAIASDDFLEIEDTSLDPRTSSNSLVTGEDNIRFYAGALLRDPHGLAIGTLCVLDKEPRRLSDFQRRALSVLSRQVMRQIELRKALATGEVLRKEIDHRVKNSLQALEALIRIQLRSEPSTDVRVALEAVNGRLSMVSSLHEALYLADDGTVVNMSNFLENVVQSAAGQMPPGIAVSCDLATCHLEARDASSVGMIVNEAIANAAKYAFEGRDAGQFDVSGHICDGVYTLICSDDGVGYANVECHRGSGLGTRIMQAAAQQLGGNLELFKGGPGFHVHLSWPLPVH